MEHADIDDLVTAMSLHQDEFRDAVIRRIRADVAPRRLEVLVDDLAPSLDRLLPGVFRSLRTGASLDDEDVVGLRDLAERWAARGATLRTVAAVAVAAGQGACEMTDVLAGGAHLAVAVSFGQGVRVAQEAVTALAAGHARGVFARRRGAGAGDGAAATVRPVAPSTGPGQDVPAGPGGDVLRLVAEGRTNSEIARALHLSRQAVGYHVSRLMRAVGAANRTALVSHAYRAGLLPLLR